MRALTGAPFLVYHPSMKAKDIHSMTGEEALAAWPRYEDWAMQLFREEERVQDRCSRCDVLLCDNYPTDEEAFRDRIRDGFGPMPKPVCAGCWALLPEEERTWCEGEVAP